MKTIKVSEATPIQLDWLVAKCNGDFKIYHDIDQGQRFLNVWTGSAFLHYSSEWGCGGPIIEREWLDITPWPHDSDSGVRWQCYQSYNIDCLYFGPTPLIAAMRCYVASKMRDEVEVPEELG